MPQASDREAPLRVALLTPYFWPEVRRGTERFVYELSTGLAARGHRPQIITGHARLLPRRDRGHGVETVRLPRLPERRLERRRFESGLGHLPFAAVALRAADPDVAHALTPADAYVATRWKQRTGRPAILSFMGIPDHVGMFQRRRRLELTVNALERCDAVVALSEAAGKAFEYWFGYEARVIPPGVDLQRFQPAANRHPQPTILCTAAMEEPRKGVPLLAEAFAEVRRTRPDARLVLNRPREPWVAKRAGVAGMEGVELADLDDDARLASAYAEAWVTALPSHSEAFGLVLVESLASGTPVVGRARGGIAEIVDRPEIGALFDSDDAEALAERLLYALELAEDPGTTAACRARAEDFSQDRCTDAYVALYRELLEAPPAARPALHNQAA